MTRNIGTALLKLVTLDVTNTLIKVAGSPGLHYASIGRKHGIHIEEDVLTGLFLKYYKHYSSKYPNFGAQNAMPSKVWWALLVKDCFQSVDSRLTDDILDKVANDLYYHFTTPKAWEFLPGALEAIKDLRQYKVKLGVISNWDHRLYKVLLTMNMRHYFDFVLPSYVVGVEKPDSYIFQQALKAANCLPEESVHFGDSLKKDFIGAQDVGMGAYLLRTPGADQTSIDQSLVVDCIADFVSAIRPRFHTHKS
ncbi:haloacid dehalogenase-like hydrolase domain-containing protein 3 [Physella acuta]|uniref:haloacid dehalogenase-like hydrolase domain-containing protein 3 n=1 Tax=Physella acuta TaxID=109671 RepID=UPI0027DD15C7|nr:haloacid dehalogenase-like hydrolase domain-containing protein 3 [Physella acuta]XP_059150926.1 haloacid dehalogenase-like hydrolase domain-containing protein 3 [Physella acuta]